MITTDRFKTALDLAYATIDECAFITGTQAVAEQLRENGLRITSRCATSRGGSRGGNPFMILNMGRAIVPEINERFVSSWANGRPQPTKRWWQIAVIQQHYQLPRWHEYASFDRDPVVGGFLSGHWEDHVRALVAHEYAHVVQYAAPHSKSRPHGPAFLKPYRILREQVVNPRLPQQPSQAEQRRVIAEKLAQLFRGAQLAAPNS